ncbi:histidine kinase osmosensor, partial [Mortierella sp. NVP85]
FGVLKTLAVKAHQKKLDLIYNVHNDFPDQLVGDPLRLRQVITSLIGNAIKFTTEGSVVLDCVCKSEADGEMELQFCVSGTGIGIQSDKIGDLFDILFQSDRNGSTGLGLSISKRLVNLMGGDLWVNSTFGKGSQFFFTVRFKVGSMSLDMAIHKTMPYVGRHILYVNTVPDEDISTSVMQALNDLKLHATHATSVEEVTALTTSPYQPSLFDVIIVDSVSAIHKIKDIRMLRFFPIVVLSMTTPYISMRVCQEQGIVSYFSPPIQLHGVMSALSTALEAPSMLPEEEVVSLRILLAEDNIVNQKLATRILEKLKHKVTVVSNGKLAVEKFDTNHFDLILMDVRMPIMGGFEATQEIRKLEALRGKGERIPIIALIGNAVFGEVNKRDKCIASGMDEYVPKPIRVSTLISTVNKFLPKELS